MPEAALYTLALLLLVAGFAWLALAMERHWRQLRPTAPPPRAVLILRLLGAGCLLCSLLLCLSLDHPSIGALVWVMALVPSAIAVTFLFSLRPQWLAPLLCWERTGR